MKLRKISARYIFTSIGEVIEKGIIVINEEGIIIDVVNTYGQITETEGLEYYSGIICPGFINSLFAIKFKNIAEARQYDLFLFKSGIVAAGDFSYKDNLIYYKQGTKILYREITSGFDLLSHYYKGIVKCENNDKIISCLASGISSDTKYLSLNKIIVEKLASETIDNFNDIVEMSVLTEQDFRIDDNFGVHRENVKARY